MMEELTDNIMLFVLVFGILYDIFVILKDGVQSSISVRLYRIGKDNPILPFAMGVLCGHWFWPVL